MRALISAVALAGLLLWALWSYALNRAVEALPQPLFDRPYATLLLSAEGELLGARVAEDGQWRFPAPAEAKLPERYRRALLSYEDKRFNQHLGVDPLALLRALWQNLSRGRVVSGASTLSMQVIRLALREPRRSLSTKLYESWLALGLERRFTKREILALYRAHAPFGGNVVGLDAAAWRYFGRPAEQLTWAEAATLAVLPNQPGLVHLKRNRARLQSKRDGLLRQLAEQGELSELDLKLSLAEPLPTLRGQLPQRAPQLLDSLSAQLKRASRGAAQGDDRASDYLRAGRLQSSLSHSLQTQLSQSLAHYGERLNRQGIDNAAVLVINNHSLQPEVYLGNLPRRAAPSAGHLDIIPRARSTGSVLKPLLFAAALDAGLISPSSLLVDAPTRFGGFRPLNADRRYRGAVSAERALVRSLNIPFVRLCLRYGVDRLLRLLRRLGLSSLTRSADDYGATLIIGGAEASLQELTSLYATLAHKLLYPDQARSEAALDQGVPTWDEDARRADLKRRLASLPISRGASWLTFESLTELARPAEYAQWRQLSSAQRVAWKTGTSQGFRDAWAIGVTPRYTVGVWVGNASGEGRAQLTGSQAAAPLLFELLGKLDGSGWFERPREALKSVEVCRDSGYLPAEGCERRRLELPVKAHFKSLDRYHKLLHLDSSGRYRVTSACWPVSEMRHESRMILPPELALHYKRHQSSYRALPPMHPNCVERSRSAEGLTIVSPREGAQLYLPRELNGVRGELVLKAALSSPGQALYWHLDGRYLDQTRRDHELALALSEGPHELVVISEEGERQLRRFTILGEGRARSSSEATRER